MSIATELDELQAEIAAAEPNAEALQGGLVWASSLLEYVSMHAGQALGRWEKQIDLRGRVGEQDTYRAFTKVAAAQLAVANLDFRDLVTSRGEDLDRSAALIESLVDHAWEVVATHV